MKHVALIPILARLADAYSRKQAEILQVFEKEMVRGYMQNKHLHIKDATHNHIVRIHYRCLPHRNLHFMPLVALIFSIISGLADLENP